LTHGSEDFEAAYDACIFRVYGFFAYRLTSREEAEDLCQVTFEHALRAWGRFDRTRAAPATWLLAIARNVLIDHYRRQPAARDRVLHEVDESCLPASAGPGPSLGLEPDLERALAGLAPRSRELIALRYGGELSGAEIAEISDLSLANVQQILSRALREMRATLDPSEQQAGDGEQPTAKARARSDAKPEPRWALHRRRAADQLAP
jgi:RNA polymerase sigma-70 factor (ECF subfamily)